MKNILIDTILYNPTIYVYNIDLTNFTATLYDDVSETVTQVKIKNNKSGVYILHNKQYHHLVMYFDITEKEWQYN